ncbi:MAG: exonuclease SbcCD subunit D [Ruminococcaceae bacterium]|nr:exonuclease SbcCD subunit D [Oscillospiraceae bacterium]
MRFFHLGDLHLGKQLHKSSLLDDQVIVLSRIVELTQEYKPDAVLIAGDIYDRSVPAGEAVNVLDDFLTNLARTETQVFLISGNHDSPERLNFASRLLRAQGIHICGSFTGELQQIKLTDSNGPVQIYLLPFIKPAFVRPWFPEAVIESYEDAVSTVIAAADPDPEARNILLAHQFVTNGGREPERSESETFNVGGVDNVDVSLFEAFDYVALGHIHGPQSIGRTGVRYAGSPLKYSFSEVNHNKGVCMVDYNSRDDLEVTMLPLQPKHDLRVIKGPLAGLIEAARKAEAETGQVCHDYTRAILTDEAEQIDPFGQLKINYPNLLTLGFDNRRLQNQSETTAARLDIIKRSPLELFNDFYEIQNNCELSAEQTDVMSRVIVEAGEEQ